MVRSAKKITVTTSNDLVTDQRMERICATLTDVGFEVEIVGRLLPNSFPINPKEYIQTRLNLIFKKGPLFYFELNFRLLFYLLFNKPDIVYSVGADTALAGVLVKKLTKLILIFDAHELFSEVPELLNEGKIKRIWQWIEKLIITKADIRITVSQSVANYYISKYKKPFEVIMNICRAKPIKIKTKGEKYILYQGALNKGRGLAELIEASKSMEIKIKIAGDGDIADKLRQQALDNIRVEFLGKLIPDELEEITVEAWLGYNLLEKQSLSYYYSLSNKTFDYIQAGIPQLMPDFPEYKKLNEEWGFGICVDLSSDEIVRTVSQLLKDENLYAKLKGNAENALRVLTWEKEAVKLEKVFESLL